MSKFYTFLSPLAILAVSAVAPPAAAQQTAEPPPPASAAQPAETARSGDETPFLKIYFASGSSHVGEDQEATLDQAARTFRAGDPFVMIVAGGADTVGGAAANLSLSLRRANSVADELVARGIPVERLQVLGRGNSELEVPTPPGVPEQKNRIVEISWR